VDRSELKLYISGWIRSTRSFVEEFWIRIAPPPPRTKSISQFANRAEADNGNLATDDVIPASEWLPHRDSFQPISIKKENEAYELTVCLSLRKFVCPPNNLWTSW
jgi:hypothetical protein